MTTLKESVTQYSTQIGKNVSLVQGAGGNVSWKENNILWVKASGTWLAEADHKDIFVPLNLTEVRDLIDEDVADFTSARISDTQLRPSIETSLHALLPQSVVVHVHAIDVIARAVMDDAQEQLAECLNGLNWMWIDYVTPGLPLTKKIAAKINPVRPPDIIVLGNHGLVIAGKNTEDVEDFLDQVLTRCRIKPRTRIAPSDATLRELAAAWKETEYELPGSEALHMICRDPISLTLARTKWVMYPDHAVFLGKHAAFLQEHSVEEFLAAHPKRPPCVLIAGKGIVINKHLSSGQHAMLQCYAEVCARISEPQHVSALSHDDILELLDWDAEKYRQKVNA